MSSKSPFATPNFTERSQETLYSQAHLNGPGFDQIDYVLINHRIKNGCIDCEADPDAEIDSDHYPVRTRFKFKLKIPIKQQHTAVYSRTQTDEHKNSCSDTFKQACRVYAANETNTITEEHLHDALKEAETFLAVKDPVIRKPWITEGTYQLIIENTDWNKMGPRKT